MPQRKVIRFPDNFAVLCISKKEGRRELLRKTITFELIVSTDDESGDEEGIVTMYCNKRPLFGFTEQSPLSAGSSSGYLNANLEDLLKHAAQLCLSEHLVWSSGDQREYVRKSLGQVYGYWFLRARQRLQLPSRGRPARFDEVRKQEICSEYRRLRDRCSRSVKPYHDSAADAFWSRREIFWDSGKKVKRRDQNFDTWRSEWLEHASRKFADVPADLLALFARSDNPSPAMAVKLYLAGKYATGPEYIETLLTAEGQTKRGKKRKFDKKEIE
jgi:hypothetical protein